MPLTTAEKLMELRDWLALTGLTYGIASDCIGESPRLQANSVAGLLWRGLQRLVHRKDSSSAPPEPSSVVVARNEPNYVKLIEDGWYHRNRLLRMPGVTGVDVALLGDHLLLTVYRQMQDDA